MQELSERWRSSPAVRAGSAVPWPSASPPRAPSWCSPTSKRPFSTRPSTSCGRRAPRSWACPPTCRRAQVESLAARALSEFGGVHIVANNAGVGGPGHRHAAGGVGVGLRGERLGVVNGCNTFLPIRLSRTRATSSTPRHSPASRRPRPRHLLRLEVRRRRLSESLHHELSMLGSAVRVSVLCPGFVRTRIHESDRNMPADVAAVADTPGALLMADLRRRQSKQASRSTWWPRPSTRRSSRSGSTSSRTSRPPPHDRGPDRLDGRRAATGHDLEAVTKPL